MEERDPGDMANDVAMRDVDPDVTGTVRRVVASGGTVAEEVVWAGSHAGPLETPGGTIAATGRQVEVAATLWLTVRDGKGGKDCGHDWISGRFRWLGPDFEKTDPDLVTIDPGQFATAERPAGRRKNQEEFLETDALDPVNDRQFGSARSDIEHHATLGPGAVDRNHLNVNTAGKFDAITLPSLNTHRHNRTTTSRSSAATFKQQFIAE